MKIYRLYYIEQEYIPSDVYDEDRLLDYKDAPIDKGKKVWEQLYERREVV